MLLVNACFLIINRMLIKRILNFYTTVVFFSIKFFVLLCYFLSIYYQ